MNRGVLDTLLQHLLAALSPAPAETRRLFHDRGRYRPDLEQLTADWLQGVLLVTLFKEPQSEELEALRRTLGQLTTAPAWAMSQGRHLILQHRYRPDDTCEWLSGEPPETWDIVENGLRFRLDLGRNQNTGLFLDMRLGRRWVQEQAAGHRVLDPFAYTCGFSVAAITGSASQMVNLDVARGPLNRGRDNHCLNGHDLGRASFLDHELFKSWGKLHKLSPCDLVIVDPSSSQKGSFVLTQDYRRILRRLSELLVLGGTPLACINDPAIGPDLLLEGTAREAPLLRFVERLENPPKSPDADPAVGLKALLFRNAGWSTRGRRIARLSP